MNTENEVPRRCFIDKMLSSEIAIRNAVLEVEKLGSKPELTDAVLLLTQASSLVSDFIDETTCPTDSPTDSMHNEIEATVPLKHYARLCSLLTEKNKYIEELKSEIAELMTATDNDTATLEKGLAKAQGSDPLDSGSYFEVENF